MNCLPAYILVMPTWIACLPTCVFGYAHVNCLYFYLRACLCFWLCPYELSACLCFGYAHVNCFVFGYVRVNYLPSYLPVFLVMPMWIALCLVMFMWITCLSCFWLRPCELPVFLVMSIWIACLLSLATSMWLPSTPWIACFHSLVSGWMDDGDEVQFTVSSV